MDVVDEAQNNSQPATETALAVPDVSLAPEFSPRHKQLLPDSFYAKQRRPTKLSDITDEQMFQFLADLAETGLWELSANRNGLSSYIIKKIKKTDERFAHECDIAISMYCDGVVQELHRRAKEGWDEPVFSHKLGVQIGTLRKYDGKLLELLVKRHCPEFRDRFEGEMKITGGVLVVPAAPMSPEDFVRLGQQGTQQALPDVNLVEPAQLPAPSVPVNENPA